MRWPRIAQFLRVDKTTGRVDDDHLTFMSVEDELAPAERAAAYEEWAAFYEWRLEQRAAELAADRVKRHLVAEWTDNMAYCCRRSAAFARGDDPGTWLPLSARRPDLAAEQRAIVAELLATPTA